MWICDTLYSILATEDYNASNFTAIFTPVRSRVCRNITILSDDIVEDFERFGIAIESFDTSVEVSPVEAVVVIQDNSGKK